MADPPRFRPWEARFLADGSLAFTVEAPPGVTLSIESSPDLAAWAPLQVITNWVGRGEIIDAGASDSPRRFYRATTRAVE